MNTDLEDNIKSALSSNPDLRDKILALVAERDTRIKELEEELEDLRLEAMEEYDI